MYCETCGILDCNLMNYNTMKHIKENLIMNKTIEKIEEILTEIDEDNIYNARYKLTTWWLQLTKKENK